MKNWTLSLALIALFGQAHGQGYFKGTFTFNPSTKVMTFSVMPVNGPITSAIGGFQFNIRYPVASTLNVGAITNLFPGQSFVHGLQDPPLYPGYNLSIFNSTSTTTSATYAQDTEYPVFSVVLSGAGSVPVDLITNYGNENSTFVVSAGNGVPLVDPAFMAIFYPSQSTTVEDDIYTSLNAALPLDLTWFSVEKKGADAALFWETASEFNSSHFEIERQTNNGVWSKIDEVRANGTTGEAHQYGLTDHGILLSRGNQTLYYRLKMVDFDGKFDYSPICSVKSERAGNAVTLSPNPSRGDLFVTFQDNGTAWMNVKVADAAGRPVFSQKIEPEKGVNKLHLDLQMLPRGAYFLTLSSESGEPSTIPFAIAE